MPFPVFTAILYSFSYEKKIFLNSIIISNLSLLVKEVWQISTKTAKQKEAAACLFLRVNLSVLNKTPTLYYSCSKNGDSIIEPSFPLWLMSKKCTVPCWSVYLTPYFGITSGISMVGVIDFPRSSSGKVSCSV